jgi:hypothetical protein
MSSDKEFICTLHSQHHCEELRSYSRLCELKIDHKYITKSCKYRLEAVVISAAEQGESPENVTQHPLKARAEATSEADVF